MLSENLMPPRVEAVLPHGPGSKPPDYAEVSGAAATREGINQAMVKWYELARREWTDLRGRSLNHCKPKLCWDTPAGRNKRAADGTTELSLAWRRLARRSNDMAKLVATPRPQRSKGQQEAFERH